jgi:DNA-directed RNA polymerase specialized sigma24 family protein
MVRAWLTAVAIGVPSIAAASAPRRDPDAKVRVEANLDVDLERTVRDMAPRVLRYAVARTGDVSAGEDVAQESLEALVRHWRRAGPPESVEAFVFSIARRRAVRAVIRRRLWVPIEQAFGRHDDAPDPEAQAVARAEHVRVRAALARLPVLEGKVVAGGIVNAFEAPNMALRHARKKPGGMQD